MEETKNKENEFGIVTTYFEDKGYGFIRLNNKRGDVFFHIKNGYAFRVNEDRREVDYNLEAPVLQLPKRGNHVVLVLTKGSRLPRANPWWYRRDFERKLALCKF